MQQIERYGVIALLLVLVTVLGVSMWSSGDEGGEASKRLAAEARRETANAPVKTTESVGPVRRAPKRTASGGGASNAPAASDLARGSAPKRGDLRPVGRSTSGPGLAVKSSLSSSKPVSGQQTSSNNIVGNRKVKVGNAAADAAAAQERERKARIRAADLQRASTNRRSKSNAASSDRVVPNPIQNQNGKLVRDPSKTTNVPGKPRADYVAKQKAQNKALTPVSNFVEPKAQSSQKPFTGSAREYTVRSGDTLSAIASRELGSAKLWPQIERANPKLNPKRLLVGTKILLPNLERTHSSAAVAALESGAKTYTVQSGDVLSKISQKALGTAKRWTEIRDLNPKVNPDRLHVGTVLILPTGGSSTPAPVRAAATSEPRVAANAPRRGKKGVVR